MNKKKLIGEYIKLHAKGLFDEVLIFGIIKKVDALDNVHIQIDKQLSKTFFHEPRWFWWNPLFQKRIVVWHDFRDKLDTFHYKKGDIVQIPFSSGDFRLSSPSETEGYIKTIEELNRIRGGWFGFP